VQASAFSKQIEELQTVTIPALRDEIDALKADVQHYRENNARLDEEVTRLRTERNELQASNTAAKEALELAGKTIRDQQTTLDYTRRELSDWHQQFIASATQVDTFRKNAEDAEYKVLELQDRIQRLEHDNAALSLARDEANERVKRVRSFVVDEPPMAAE
jgi:chromosome segregation ATPase